MNMSLHDEGNREIYVSLIINPMSRLVESAGSIPDLSCHCHTNNIRGLPATIGIACEMTLNMESSIRVIFAAFHVQLLWKISCHERSDCVEK